MNSKTSSTKRPSINTHQLYNDIQAMRELNMRGRPDVLPSELFEVSQSLGQDCAEDVETILAQHMLRLFKDHDLTGAQAKRLLDRVRLLVDAEMGLF